MRVWMVHFNSNRVGDGDCVWTNRSDAIAYLKTFGKENNWKINIDGGGDENPSSDGDDDDLYYICFDEQGTCCAEVEIIPIFLDEKPYFFIYEDNEPDY